MKKDSTKTVLLAAGGTGGHLFPAVAVGEKLTELGHSVHLVTDKRCKKYLSDIKFKVSINDLYFSNISFLHRLMIPFKILKSLVEAFFRIKRIKPVLVVGFGGYPTFPILLVAKLLGIDIILHEQNCFLGKVNKLFSPYAKMLATSYKNTQNIPPLIEKNPEILLYTGAIIRQQIVNLPKKNFDEYNSDFTIFVFGGSQGASFFSEIMPDVAAILVKKTLKIRIIQQARSGEQKMLAKIYSSLGIKYELASFFYNIEEIYNKSDTVIARSGSGTLAELTYIGMPAIYIPYPDAADDHQYYNAKSLSDDGAAFVIRQQDCTASFLADKILDLISAQTRRDMQKQLLSFETDGCVKLASKISGLITTKKDKII